VVVRGTIFLHRNLVFKNGVVGRKYLILLNTPGKGQPYLFVKTTSRQKDKPKISGCIRDRSLFFIPAKKTFFSLDTWVQLYELYAVQDADKDPDLKIVDTLHSKTIDEIVRCLFLTQTDDLSSYHKGLLNQPLGDSLQKLQEHFKNRKPQR
jgi:hypothetical protein